MQNTLLGLAIAIILALVAALVGPLLIDWGGHRSLFETEASRLIGIDVRVTGAIEARLLPTPSLTLHDIEIGGGDNKVRARALGFEFALGPLMRGEWRAAEMHLVGPQLRLGLDASGHVIAPNLAINFNPDSLSIDRLSVEDGKLTLTDAANGSSATLNGVWFNGEARSLLGPFKGEGAATVGTELYPFRIAAGRYSDNGAVKLHVNVDPVNRPLSIEVDGMLALAGAEPKFDGTLSLTRPVGIASRSGAQKTETLSQPWRVSGKIKVSAASALMEQFEFQYGSEEQGLKLTGVAEFKFGKRPRFDGVLSGRQIDLDRALAGDDGTRTPPAAAIRKIAELAGSAFRPAIPIQIGVGIDQVTLGGSTVANVRGDISTDATGWNLDRFEFRAPGFTQVKLSGHLAVGADGVRFTGPAEIEAGNPKLLAAWLEGRNDVAQPEARPLTLRGDVTLRQRQNCRRTSAGRFRPQDRHRPPGLCVCVRQSGGPARRRTQCARTRYRRRARLRQRADRRLQDRAAARHDDRRRYRPRHRRRFCRTQCERAFESGRQRRRDRTPVGRRSRRRRLFGERPHRDHAVAARQHAGGSRCVGYDAGVGAAGQICAENRAVASRRCGGHDAGQAARAIHPRRRGAGDDCQARR